MIIKINKNYKENTKQLVECFETGNQFLHNETSNTTNF